MPSTVLATFAAIAAVPYVLERFFDPPPGADDDISAVAAVDSPAIDARRYPEVSFAATHNSYSGGIEGRRSSIRAQLDRGVRSIELDVHDEDYEAMGFRVGHLSPGDAVYHGDGNPEGDALLAWLELISDWSLQNPRHAPITLVVDLKDCLAENSSFESGDLFALNALLVFSFGERLLHAEQIERDGWPAVGEMRGKILVVLSGDEASRVAYRGISTKKRPEQLAFVEMQHGERELAGENLFFYAAPAAELTARMWALSKRAAGKVTRLWCFNDADLTREASVNFPATDLPFARWYRGYGDTIGCAK